MIRFVDLTNAYWTDPSYGKPVCAFLSTNTDTFLMTIDNSHVFHDMQEIEDHEHGKRMKSLMPKDFFGLSPLDIYVNEVCGFLPPIQDPKDLEAVLRSIKQNYERGFTIQDCVRYELHTEEVNPDMPEDVALNVLDEISGKYNDPT